MQHNAMMLVSSRLGYIYCQKCAEANPSQEYERASMRLGDVCDVCKCDPEIVNSGPAFISEQFTAKIF